MKNNMAIISLCLFKNFDLLYNYSGEYNDESG